MFGKQVLLCQQRLTYRVLWSPGPAECPPTTPDPSFLQVSLVTALPESDLLSKSFQAVKVEVKKKTRLPEARVS